MEKDNKQRYTDQFKGYLADYDETQDITSLLKLYQMIKDGKVKLTAVDKSTVGFLAYNRGDGKCSRCQAMCFKALPIFYQDGKRWCVPCATEQEKDNSFYKSFLKKQEKTID